MSIFRPEVHREPPKSNDNLPKEKPDRTDILALIIAAFQVLGPYVLVMVAAIVLVAVLILKVWAH